MKIICIGRNYHDHVKEMNIGLPEEPVFFMKPDTAVITRNRPFFYPEFSSEIHHEVEIVFRICKVGKYIQEKFANTYYKEIAIGLDFTARDLQREAISKGLPWEKTKGFDGSAPLSLFVPLSEISGIKNLNFSLKKNGETVQKGNTADMIFGIDKLISHISQFITLKMGDLIFTGTPTGVGPVKIGDKLTAYIEDKKMLSCNIR
ncbi:MAG: fumarylacetoacetate hydrolase family protein [Bacteroidales bacterium]|jgi:2-keto-4-pentenoate hydratase/2-oxohepta-3-ene-1,7-dioic acid hydratase in catechol pathway|nr:fumarylacetoacetate hydrolase family protein [Bacteroidales bacterium]MDD4214613.1 fumarylacetoacetate hydrolase family protein [Bacteroidales bacterium]